MREKFVEYYEYKGITFKITYGSNKQYYAICINESMDSYSDDLEDLKKNKIPQKYKSSREEI